MTSALFQPIRLGAQELKHRVALAPLTRLRNVEYTPNAKPSQAIYYAQRSTPGGLLITEATLISPSSGSYKLAPGIWNDEQAAGWRKIVSDVHAKGGIIYCQIWHLGRASAKTYEYQGKSYPPLSASATAVQEGAEISKELTVDEIQQIVKDYANAAKLAIEVGFDGVEIHGANGYLVDQFLQTNTNKRTDQYGGSLENRLRFPLEVLDACVKAIGEERVGIRESPFSEFQGMLMEKPLETFIPYNEIIAQRYPNLAFVHLVEPRVNGSSDKTEPVPESLDPFREIIDKANAANQTGSGIRFISAGGVTPEHALADSETRPNEIFAFGRHFIANPDLPARIQNHWPLTPYDRSTFYTAEEEGYTDLPFYQAASA